MLSKSANRQKWFWIVLIMAAPVFLGVRSATIRTTAFTRSLLYPVSDPNEIRPLLAGPEINVKDSPYLATGDGVTNDTAAVQAAIDAAEALVSADIMTLGPTVVFPPGHYICTVSTNEAIRFVGNGARLEAVNATEYALTFDSTSGGYPYLPRIVQGLTFAGASETKNGLHFDWGNAAIVRDCSFTACITAVHMSNTLGLVVENSWFSDGDYGIRTLYDDSVHPCSLTRISQSSFNGYDVSAIYFDGQSDQSYIEGCIIELNKGMGIAAVETYGSMRRGIHISDTWMEQNGVNNGSGFATVLIDGDTIEPVDCYFQRCSNVTYNRIRLFTTWLKESNLRTYDCGYYNDFAATGETEAIVGLDLFCSVTHNELGIYDSTVSDVGHTNNMVVSARIMEDADNDNRPIAWRSAHKTNITRGHINLLGSGAPMNTDYTPVNDDGQTEGMAQGGTPIKGFRQYWTTTVDANMAGITGDAIQLYNNIAITKENFHVWSMCLRAVGDDLTCGMSWAGMPARLYDVALPDGVWKTVTGIMGATDTNTPDWWIWCTHPTNSGSIDISAMQLVAFTTLQDALNYANSDLYATLESTSVELLSTTIVSLAANAETEIYTVPTGYSCVLHHSVLVVGADAGTTDISIGQNGAETDFVPATDLANLDAAGDSCILEPIMLTESTPKIEAYPATTSIRATITNQAGGATNTIYLYGKIY